MSGIALRKTYLKNESPGQNKKLDSAMEGYTNSGDLKEHQQKEMVRRLEEKGLDLDYVATKYKDIADTKIKSVRASDVLKVLERVEEIHGLRSNSQDQLQIRAMTQTKTPEQITTTLIEITGKTQAYINKLTNSEL